MNRLQKVVVLVIGFIILAVAVGSKNSAPTPPAKVEAKVEEPKKIIPPPNVGEEISQEYFKQVNDEAYIECKHQIENQATYDFKWDNWLGVAVFKQFNKYQRADGHLIMRGDEAKAQDRFGNWFVVNYYCEYDPATKKVVEASFTEGKLPRIR